MICHKRTISGPLCNTAEGRYVLVRKLSEVNCPGCKEIIKFKRAQHNEATYGKPPGMNEKLTRKCLKCSQEFETSGRFNFLCGCHTEGDYELNWNERR